MSHQRRSTFTKVSVARAFGLLREIAWSCVASRQLRGRRRFQAHRGGHARCTSRPAKRIPKQGDGRTMKRGTLIAAVVLAIGAFACERKHDDKAGETTTTSGTVREEQSTGTGYNYQGSPGVTGGGTTNAGNEGTDVSGATTGTDRNMQPGTGSQTGSTTTMGSG